MTEENNLPTQDTPITDLSHEDFNANFSTLLAHAKANDSIEEADTEDEPEAEESEEIIGVPEDDAEDQPETETEEEPDPSIEKSVKYFKEQARKADADRLIMEQKYNDLIKAIEENLLGDGNADGSNEDDFEPLDEEAHKRYLKQAKELEDRQNQINAQINQQNFIRALEQAEAKARAEYPDFDKAFEYYQGIEVAKLRAMGVDDQAAMNAVTQELSRTAHIAWQQGRDVGKMFYDVAKSVGYKSAKTNEINHDAIAKNRARTEKKPIKSVNPTETTTNMIDRLQSAMKDGRVDPNQFQKMLKEHRG